MHIVYANEEFPSVVTKSIFLAGPTPRDGSVASWRPEALQHLNEYGFDGHVFVPEPRNGTFEADYFEQVEWESQALSRADVIVFWVPRSASLPGFTTNVEFGMWASSGKVVLGCPDEAEKVRYLQYWADKLHIPVYNKLQYTLVNALSLIGAGSLRKEGEATVPLSVWQHPTFQKWYQAQCDAGNTLRSAKVLWSFRVGPNLSKLFCWILHVEMWVETENRVKANEFVLGRLDTASVALFYRPEWGSDQFHILDAKVLLVREFRSPARTPTGYILELPGGSSTNPNKTTNQVVIEELEQETGLVIDPRRLTLVKNLQVAGTLSAHNNTLFVGDITREELEQIWKVICSNKTFGVEEDTEKTYVELRTVRHLVRKGNEELDWSSLGMILTALMQDIA